MGGRLGNARWEKPLLFIHLMSFNVPEKRLLCKQTQRKHMTKSKPLNRKQMPDHSPPSAAGSTHLGEEAPLVNEKT
jgi:hypothetical protein